MPHPSKRKGCDYERELRDAFHEAGLRCVRAWGSNGATLKTDCGHQCTSDVDLLIEGRLKAQAKRRAKVANYLTPPEGAHITIVREDRGDSIVTIPLDLFLQLLTRVYQSSKVTT